MHRRTAHSFETLQRKKLAPPVVLCNSLSLLASMTPAASISCRLLQLASCLALIISTTLAHGIRYGRSADFDYFYLVRQWPATFCNEHSCTHRPPRRYAFTIHGLWPEREDGTWPEYCDPGSELDEDAIEDLLPELEAVWPSWSSDDATFWNHEWKRHGTCAESVVGGQHAFFEAVLKLHKKLNIQAALEAAGVVPSNTHQYKAEEILSAIKEAHGVMPHITCDHQGDLAEVWMCINKDLKAVDCAQQPSRAAAAAASQGLAAAAIQTANNYCKYVRIPRLDMSVVTTRRLLAA